MRVDSMTGNVPAVLSEAELKSIIALVNRLPWGVAKPVITSLGLTLGKGRDATYEKILKELSELKTKSIQKFNSIIQEIDKLLFGQFIYGDKALFSLTVDTKAISTIDQRIEFDWGVMNQPSSLSDTILSKKEIQNSKKNQLELIHYSTDSNQSIVLFSSVREQIVREKIIPSTIPQYSSYDEIIAKKKEKHQCFDVCIIDKATSKIYILIDSGLNTIGESILFAKSNVVRTLYNYAGYQFNSAEKDFFPLIDEIFNQKKPPYSLLKYKVFDLSFLTPEGTTHKEKKNDKSNDLRKDLFNQEGIKAVGNIGLYRIGVRLERVNPALQLLDNVELIIPGTLRRYLGGSSSSPVTFAILSQCISRDDFEILTKLIL
ncbi:hypothetical protein L473_01479 [Klebsiella pneumoniae BIDMC 36]|nr:hypothetical protein L473_01479 [Klebsiella pneumoniae BIDMC 36]